MSEKTVQTVSIEEDGTIVLGWADPAEQTKFGGTAFQTYITPEAQEHDVNVAYFANELRQDVVELLEAYLKMGKP